MLELIVLVLLAVAAVIILVAVFLWHNGALNLDRDKAKKNIDRLIDEAKSDVKNWRDHLGKK